MTDLTSGQVDYEGVNSKVGGKLRRGDEGQGLSTCIRNNYWLEQLRIDPLKAGEFTRHLLIPFGCTGLYPRSLSSAGVNSASRSP